jgi:hypothetical protein
MERAPRWTDLNSEPPIALIKATQIALQWAKLEYHRFDDVEINEINLRKSYCSSLSDTWYYVIDFAPIIDGNRILGSGYFAAVLMDGTVVGPKRSKQEPLEPQDRDPLPPTSEL